jgi:hypothetical protein
VALGGSSYAAITITGKNVKNSSLTGADVKNSSLTGADVKNRSITAADLAAGAGGGSGGEAGTQILSKLLGVDGSGSKLDADLLDGLGATAFQRRGGVTSCAGANKVTGIGENGDVACAADSTAPSGPAGGDLQGTYPDPQLAATPPFQDLTLLNGWVTWGGGGTFANLSVTKDAMGFVHLRGAVDGTLKTSNVIAVLPAAYRATPQFTWLTVTTTTGSFDPKPGVLEIDNVNGNMKFYPGTGADGKFVGVDGLTFYGD